MRGFVRAEREGYDRQWRAVQRITDRHQPGLECTAGERLIWAPQDSSLGQRVLGTLDQERLEPEIELVTPRFFPVQGVHKVRDAETLTDSRRELVELSGVIHTPMVLHARGTVRSQQMSSGKNVTRVLLVSHEATRTGAPLVALQIAPALRDSGHEVVTVLRARGPLAREFVRESSRTVHEPFIRLRAGLRLFRKTRALASRLDLRIARRVLRREQPAVAYLNTVKSACYVRPAVELAIPVVLHVHEMEPLASSTLTRYRLDDLYPRIQLVACSEAARDNLARITRTDLTTITVVTSTIDIDEVTRKARALRDDLGQDPNRPMIIGACATADTRKGVDLWLGMAAHLRCMRPELAVRFRWVGRVPRGGARNLATPYETGGNIEFCGEVDNPYPLIAEMDVFTLPSRSDAFPLVVLEAMALRRAIVAFALPGVVEQLGDTAVLVEPERPEAMARAVSGLLDDPDRRRELGSRAAERVYARFGLEVMRESVRHVVADAMLGPGEDSDAAAR